MRFLNEFNTVRSNSGRSDLFLDDETNRFNREEENESETIFVSRSKKSIQKIIRKDYFRNELLRLVYHPEYTCGFLNMHHSLLFEAVC
jgi:hypothetical protein